MNRTEAMVRPIRKEPPRAKTLLLAPVVIVAGFLLSSCDSGEVVNSATTVTPSPEASATPSYDLQMPPKPAAGTSCSDVLEELNRETGDENFFQAGKGLIFDIKSFARPPEETLNGTIIVGGVENQAQFDAVIESEEPKLEDWYSGTQVEDQLRIDWMAGSPSGRPGVYIVNEEITYHRTGPVKGAVCLTEEEVSG
ncbi:MAG: hypothetical protein AAB521_04350 [Patescibacteria group bacterium]